MTLGRGRLRRREGPAGTGTARICDGGHGMVGHRWAVLTVATLTLATGAGRLAAEEPRADTGKKHDRVQMLAKRLGLDEKQQDQVKKIREDYDLKTDPVEHMLWALHHGEHEAVRKVLNDDQRAKLPVLMREEHHHWRNPVTRHEHMKAVFEKLDLSADQKETIKKIHAEYDPKMKEAHTQLRKLHQEEHEAMEKVLTAEQRTKWQEIRKQHRLEETPGDKK